MRSLKYDVVIVGAGPAGIFTALELLKNKNLKVLIIEKGKDIRKRECPNLKISKCAKCIPCNIISGWGGAGAFSDGKLNLSKEIGGFLSEYIDPKTLSDFIEYVDQIYLSFGAPEVLYAPDEATLKKITAEAAKNGLLFIPSKIRHIGTEKCKEVLTNLQNYLEKKVDLLFETEVEEILVSKNKVKGVKLKDGRQILASFVVIAPGRSGNEWVQKECKRLKLSTSINPVDIGVRVEVPAAVMEDLTSKIYEPKFIYFSQTFDDKVRTFCVNPYGEVVTENIDGIWTVNGHSYATQKTENTNFAILCSTYFTEPFKEPVLYGKNIAKLANFLGNGVLVQRLGDIKRGRRSNEKRIARNLVQPTLKTATPGDLSFVLPYRYLVNILEMLDALDRVIPGVGSPYTLLYGVEVKFYSLRIKLTSNLETEVKNLFAAGDGAGITRGLIQASVSGVIVAREILRRFS
ncbi:NAD(P)/FAD-dependent oxidoreductase [Thermodesulfobacterium sp. TA1]|uniref:NAD(P)/FAD-dependent oxidoreductase n=1 Tax=Thermodesulfobacterium sp. TA1 TaxID=2234087 RepID=UPI001232A880|nr:NAD(P)/FAD-dependent oxidoreductase [Thermodesulfobacterium sp. TA1]QER42162.1 NAD(P)/FAD-dependent oxidoreductase [Thermodesulfobacterium sp. TA1]